ncbi:MAG: iron-siderophore ABC transporter substrate-binding protein [Cyanobacteria bacterium P01_G01_bin.19]
MSFETLKLKPFLIALLATLLVVGCQNKSVRQPIDSQLADCRKVQHVLGEACVPTVPQRLITLDETTLADALALDVPSVGASYFGELADYLAEKSPDLEFLGQADSPSLEKIFQLNPDLILGIEFNAESIFPQLSQVAPTAVGEWNGYPSWREHFDFVARVLAKEDKAKTVWSNYNQRIEELRDTLGDDLQDLEISLAFTYGREITLDAENSFAGSILADLGVSRPKSQAAIVDGTIAVSEERLSDIDADILFMSVYDEDSEKTLASWQQKPLWNQLQVVKNKRVYLVDASIWRGGDPLAANLILDDLYKYLVEQP